LRESTSFELFYVKIGWGSSLYRDVLEKAVTLNEAKTSRPRPELRGRGRGRCQFLEVEAKAEAKNNYENVPDND